MIQDFESSGLIDLAARKYRVIAFDRPGYGHSDRPRSSLWTPEAQAGLIRAALAQMGVKRATVLGQSWGCSVAVALAHKYPDLVGGLGPGLRLLLSDGAGRRGWHVGSGRASGR